MADKRLKCALVFRLDLTAGASSPTILAKFDHACQYEYQNGSLPGTLYGGHDRSVDSVVSSIIHQDPPLVLEPGTLEGSFKCVRSDQYQVTYGADEDGIGIAVITGLEYPHSVAFQMLQELYAKVKSKFPAEILATVGENSLTKKSKAILSEACARYDDLSQVNKTHALGAKVELVKLQVHENVMNIMENIDSAEALNERASELNEMAVVFETNAKKVRNKMAWKDFKLTLMISGFFIMLVAVWVLVPLIKKART